ncbi:MAG: methyltransferase [Bdellovibrionales bacterium]|nr:methyltransferase [Bdellovibrionales bacterium]
MTVWKLQQGREKRIRTGHPWVFSNELSGSPKGVTPGQIVELQDFRGDFVARGYAHPASLICFRVLTREASDTDPLSANFVFSRFKLAAGLRMQSGLQNVSFRLVFGESDSLPGLIVDRFFTGTENILVTQAHTAGAQKIQELFLGVAERVSAMLDSMEGAATPRPWTVVVRNDVRFRELEGLTIEPTRIIGAQTEESLKSIEILVRSASHLSPAPLKFSVNLWDGQKTGFFLDQASNIHSFLQLLTPKSFLIAAPTQGSTANKKRKLKVLDLCCFVGQWSAQIANHLKALGIEAEFHLVDSSAAALEFASKNVNRVMEKSATRMKKDVMTDLVELGADYDIVICDPPALIKSRKDQGAGTQAYGKLNTIALERLKDNGFFVTCSCSGLLTEEDFQMAISKGIRKAHKNLSWLQRGSPAPDHPVRFEFPEGKYLKCWIGLAQK